MTHLSLMSKNLENLKTGSGLLNYGITARLGHQRTG